MPHRKRRERLVIPADVESALRLVSHSRTEPARRVEKARILLAYSEGQGIEEICRKQGTNHARVGRLVDRAIDVGPWAALNDAKRSGRPRRIPSEARTWLVSLACQKPKELGYSYELWTFELLQKHVRAHCETDGHPSLRRIGKGTISKFLRKAEIQPHKIQYYLERRDPDFKEKMVQILHVYKEIEVKRSNPDELESNVATISYDEKPGIQAIENTAPDLPPVPGEHPTISRDYEYKRHGTVSLMAGLDLETGVVHGNVVNRHRSREFIDFLKILDGRYPPEKTLRIILDNHSAHTSKETRGFLATVPGRFQFVFTPKHGSWLNLIESFFSKMTRSMLRGIRVCSKAELKARIEQYLREINEMPVMYRWTYRMEELAVA